MKRASNLYKDISNLDNIIEMTNKVLAKIKNKDLKEKFILHKMKHIINIKNRIDSKNIKFHKYHIFYITDPKFRIIMSLDIEDKIINHLVGKYILDIVFEPKYIDSVCATRINKGTSYAIYLMKKYLNNMKLRYDNFYILKLDIKKYFYNIDHNILKRILSDNIKDIDVLNILFNIIDSTNLDYINKKIINIKNNRIKYIKNNKLIEEVNSIPLYEYGKGCGIGNQTSQSFGLIYLNEICHFIKEELHIKYLINFMDDFVIIHENKEYLRYCLNIIKDKLYNDYKLEINDKTRIYNINEGIEFLGFRFIIKNNRLILKLRNSTKYKFKKNMKRIKLLKEYQYISDRKFKLLLDSLRGFLKYGNCNNLYYKNLIH